MLPVDFTDKMKMLLKDEFDEFLEGYDKERQYGFRRNPIKISREEFEKLEFVDGKVLWAEDGYYYNELLRPGKSPLHEAGAFYIQEPSAMAVAQLCDVKEGEMVLDLCAAPGGKSTQLAGKMNGKGLLVSNEINPQRAKILSQNIERLGISNCVVLNEDSERLAARFPSFFDKIIVDAPCSGEGMFRKDENACNEWSLEQVKICADRQLEILNNAFKMLKQGGIIVYSTCTFAPEENEGTIAKFINEHNDARLLDCNKYDGFDSGRPEWTGDISCDEVSKAIRLWPHRLGGEGHFVAKLTKISGEDVNYQFGQNKSKKLDTSLFKAFEKEYLGKFELDGDIIEFGKQLYCIPTQMISLKGLKVVRPGLQLGENKKNRFEPSHALAMALSSGKFKDVYGGIVSDVQIVDMSIGEAYRYQAGETIECDKVKKGWVLMTVMGVSTGWGKASNGVVKNHYPKGIRRICK